MFLSTCMEKSKQPPQQRRRKKAVFFFSAFNASKKKSKRQKDTRLLPQKSERQGRPKYALAHVHILARFHALLVLFSTTTHTS